MKPNKPGIWEWYDDDETKRLVYVFNVFSRASDLVYLRVYFWGGYYNVFDGTDDPGYEWATKTEWPPRWGNRVGDIGSLPQEQLYLMPDKEEMDRIRELYNR